MHNSARSCAGSSTCRIDWRPSRWLCAGLAALSLLAAGAVLASEMPAAAAWPLALLALAHGARLAWRQARRRPRAFVFAGEGAPVRLDGARIDEATVSWRGPLAFVRWRGADGRIRRLAWWPDTLPAAQRRELRLAAPGRRAARGRTSVAP